MKNLFTRLRSWYTANRKYDGFVVFVWFLLFTTLMFIGNIVISADRQDWIIWTLWLLTVIYNFCFWQKDKNNHEVTQFLIDRSAEMVENLANELAESQKKLDDALSRITALRLHLIGANRRRKRAERKLKWYVKTLRKESADRLGFELQCDEYESVLLDANLAMADIGRYFILPDTKAMAEAQQRFKAYMKIHYAEIANRQLNRELKKSAFGCLFFGDANGDPKDIYSGIFGGEDFSSTENKETKQQ